MSAKTEVDARGQIMKDSGAIWSFSKYSEVPPMPQALCEVLSGNKEGNDFALQKKTKTKKTIHK